MTKGLEAFEYIKNFTFFQDDCYKTQLGAIKQDLENYEKLKQHMEEEYKGLVNAMQQNLDFSDEEDVRHYDKLQAQAFILNKFLIMLERWENDK